MVNRYNIADKVVEVTSIHAEVHEYCSDYLTDEPADYSITTTQADIDLEREKSAREDEIECIPTRHFSDSYLEELAVYRKIAEKMIEYDTVLFHGSVIAVDGIGYLFTAKSGTGKSTHTRLWREYFGNRAVMVNDDKPLLHIAEIGVIAYGTPYNGKHRLGTNISVPLKAICILTRSADNHIEPITREQVYTMLLQQVYRPADMLKMAKTLELVDRLADSVKLYKLGCNMEISAAQVAYEGMQ
ncbi:MAG TPA: hypothetical protein PLH83_16430 [Ruminococcus sp.]|nr:hypothetical protein [Ruminococcus sp.]